MFVFDDSDEAVVVPVTLEGGTFNLILSHPTVEQRMRNDAVSFNLLDGAKFDKKSYTERYIDRLDCVTGWDGLSGRDQKPIPYSKDRLLKLISKQPTVMDQISDKLNALFSVDTKLVGESSASPSDSQPDKTEDIQPSHSTGNANG